jgi:hypothetical protein
MSQHRRSIQDIIPPARSKPIRERPSGNSDVPDRPEKKLPLKPRRVQKQTGMVGLLGIAFAVIIFVGGAFGFVSTVFHRAEITITPYVFLVPVADTFSATQGENTEGISYQMLQYQETATRVVPSTSTETVENRAQGTITVYNEYSTQPQRLVTNTRFESEDGRIYRIENPITVPGYTVVSGTKTPGSITVTVYADEPGEEYNGGATTFTIPGLAGSPQFTSMYARTTDGISGGFIGERPVVDTRTREDAVLIMKNELEEKIRRELLTRVAPHSFFDESLITVRFIEQPDRAQNDGAEVSLQGIAEMPVFSESEIAQYLAQQGRVSFDAPLLIQNRDALTVEFSQEEEDDTRFKVLVSGEAQLRAFVDTDVLVRDFVERSGEGVGGVGSILTRYPGIQDLQLSIYPFWRQTLPKNGARYTIKVDE